MRIKVILLIFIIGFFAFICFAARVFAEEAKLKDLYVELILDSSNSMNEILNDKTKLDIAKEVLNEVLDDLSKDTYLALRVYGAEENKLQIAPGMTEEDAKKNACSDSVLKLNFGKNNSLQAKQIIQASEAAGYTPIAYSLELAGNDFPLKQGNNYIILASDGQESCGGDPIAVVNALKTKGINIVVHTIGFGVDEMAKKQLETIAKAGGGQYYSADTAVELKESFIKIVQDFQDVRQMKGEAKDFFLKGGEVVPGSSYDDAPMVGPGEYRLSNLALGANVKHIVKITLKKSQMLKGIATFAAIAGPKTRPTTENQCSLNTFDQHNRNIFSDNGYVSIEKPQTFDFWSSASVDTEYYIVFNSTLNTTWNEEAPQGFSVGLSFTIQDQFDAGLGSDVGMEFKEAHLIAPGEYNENWIYHEADIDKYKLGLKTGEKISIKVFPSEKWSAKLIIYNEDRENVFESTSNNDGAVAKGEYTTDHEEEIYFSVEKGSSETTGLYEMDIKVTASKLEASLIKDKDI